MNFSLDRSRIKVLLLIEDQELCDLASWNLEAKGYCVEITQSIHEALGLQELCGWNFDIILSDWLIPGELSVSDLAHISKSFCPRSRTIFVSNNWMETHTNKGPIDLILYGKPINFERLFETIDSIAVQSQNVERQTSMSRYRSST